MVSRQWRRLFRVRFLAEITSSLQILAVRFGAAIVAVTKRANLLVSIDENRVGWHDREWSPGDYTTALIS